MINLKQRESMCVSCKTLEATKPNKPKEAPQQTTKRLLLARKKQTLKKKKEERERDEQKKPV